MSIGKNLKGLRVNKGWTQGDLSKETGIKVAHISKLENNEGDPKLSTILKLTKGLGCDANELVFNKIESDLEAITKHYLKEILNLNGDDKKALFNVMDKFLLSGAIRSIQSVGSDTLSDIMNDLEVVQSMDKEHIDKLIDDDEEVNNYLEMKEVYEHRHKNG